MSTQFVVVIGAIATIIAAFGGAALGAHFAYRAGIKLATLNRIKDAEIKLRVAFAPEIAEMRLFANGQKKVDVEHLLTSAFPRHATAIEEFSVHVPIEKKEAYYNAWKQYYEQQGSIRFYQYYGSEEPKAYFKLFEKNIHAILQFVC